MTFCGGGYNRGRNYANYKKKAPRRVHESPAGLPWTREGERPSRFGRKAQSTSRGSDHNETTDKKTTTAFTKNILSSLPVV